MPEKTVEEKYQDALDYLYRFIDYSLTRSFRFSEEKFDLNRMVRLMKALGDPQQDYKIVHIAGTKGKGSTAAFCSQAFLEAGFRTGLYTSPHLEDYCERIQVDGVPITHEALVELVNEIKSYVSDVPELTTFEITTALALWFFSRMKVQVVVAEVGLGGRLDATNIITPLVSVITSISYDHTQILGSTLAEIAAEKAGIIKQGVPVVMSPQNQEAHDVIVKYCLERNAPLYIIGRDVLFQLISRDLKGQEMQISYESGLFERLQSRIEKDGTRRATANLHIPLLGTHQLENAAAAYAAVQVCNTAGMNVSEDAIKRGFKNVNWPARFEILSTKPLIIVDSAHNLDSSGRLKQTLDEYLPGSVVHVIFGASEDKDIRGMLQELMPRINRLYATKSQHPRAESVQNISVVAKDLEIATGEYDSVEEALRAALEDVQPGGIILATGSIFIAAAVRSTWMKQKRNMYYEER